MYAHRHRHRHRPNPSPSPGPSPSPRPRRGPPWHKAHDFRKLEHPGGYAALVALLGVPQLQEAAAFALGTAAQNQRELQLHLLELQALHVHCTCAVCALHVRCVCTACALRVHCARMPCAR